MPNSFDLEAMASVPAFTPPPKPRLSLEDQIGDVLMAVPRGVESAVQDAYGLVDTVAFGALPDYKTKFLGESQTGVGQFVENAANFAAGFIPVSGVLSKLGKASKALSILSNPIVKGAVAGAITDFTVFDGHESRLSNLIQSYPKLANPITEFLAASDDDGEITGRLKNSLEGLGVGSLVDGLFAGLRKVKAGRAARLAGKTPEEVHAAMDSINADAELQRAVSPEAEVKGPLDAPPEPIGLRDQDKPLTLDGENDLFTTDQYDQYAGRKRRRGPDELLDRLKAEIRLGKIKERKAINGSGKARAFTSVEPADIHILETLVDRIGGDKFKDLALSIKSGQGGSTYDFLSSVITLSREAIDRGDLENHAVHELWHSLERYVPDESLLPLRKQFRRELDAFVKQYPQLADKATSEGINVSIKDLQAAGFSPVEAARISDYAYRLRDNSEWFAETMREKSLMKVDDFLDATEARGFKSVMLFARNWLVETFQAIKAKFGFDHAQKLVNDFFNRRVGGRTRNMPLTAGSVMKYLEDPEAAAMRDIGLQPGDVKSIIDEASRREAGGLDPKLNPREMDPADLAEQGITSRAINFSNYNGDPSGLNTARAIEATLWDTMERSNSLIPSKDWATQNKETLQELADLTGSTAETLEVRLRRGLKEDSELLPRLNARIRAYRVVLQKRAEEFAKRIAGIDMTSLSDREALELLQHSANLAETVSGVKGLTAEQGRGLNSLKIPVENPGSLPAPRAATASSAIGPVPTKAVKDMTAEEVQLAVRDAGGLDQIKKTLAAAETAFAEGGLAGGLKIVTPTRTRRAINMLNEYFINSIFSGGKTMATNVLSSVGTSIYRPLEAMLGSGVRALMGGSGPAAVELRRSLKEISALVKNVPEAIRAAASDAPGLLSASQRQFEPAITAKNAGLDPTSLAGKALDAVGKVVRVPTNLLGRIDEFTSQMNYRAVVEADLWEQAITAGKSGEEAAKFVAEGMETMIRHGQAYSMQRLYKEGLEVAKKNPQLLTDIERHEAALNYAQQNFDPTKGALSKRAEEVAQQIAFTTPLRPGSVSSGIQRIVNQHPLLRMVLPVIRGPVNIATFAAQRLDMISPARFLMAKGFGNLSALEGSRSRFIQDMLSGDSRRASEAVGRLAMGAAVYTTVATAAMNGTITGRGPSDKEQRDLLMASGWLPYSIKIGDGYVQYNRLDPISTMVGTIADVVDYTKYSGPEEDESIQTFGTGVAVALLQNLTNKTYLIGLKNWFDALAAPDKKASSLLQRYAGSMVPSFLNQSTTVVGSDETKDIQSMADAIRARIPGYADDLPPIRNVLGQPVRKITSLGYEGASQVLDMFLPIAYSEVKDDVLMKEFAALRHGFTPPKAVKNGIDLRTFKSPSGQNAYDRWLEIQGSIKLDGRTLESALKRRISQADYQRLSSRSTFEANSPRISELDSIISKFNRAAYRQLLREYPDLQAADKKVMNTKKKLRLGVDLRDLAQ